MFNMQFFGIKFSALSSLTLGIIMIGAVIDAPVGLISESIFLVGASLVSFGLVNQFMCK